MALTVVKYRKTATGETTAVTPAILIKSKLQQPPQRTQQQQQITKKPIIKLGGNPGLIINKIPASIKPAMKRSAIVSENTNFKSPKFSLQTVASAGTPLTSFQWQQTIGGSSNVAATPKKQSQQQQIGAAISSLPPNTIIQATSGSSNNSSLLQSNGIGATITPVSGNAYNAFTTQGGATVQVRRPTIYIKREVPKRTIRSVTLELIENNPYVHLGVSANRLPVLKNIVCETANVSIIDCYVTLKKLRQNEEFALLAEYFEMTETEVQQVFAHGVVKLARYLHFLIRWPDSKKYYDRHKNLPFAFRSNLSHVQSLIECVETDIQRPMQVDCSNFKFILSITTTGIISYISEAYVGHHDDLAIFAASNFQSVIPKYLSLVADPGKAVRRKWKSRKSDESQKTNSSSNNNNNAKPNASKGSNKNNMEIDSTTDSADESFDDLDTEDTDDGRSLSKYAASRVAAELASHQTLKVVNSELTSRKVKDFAIPTMRVREPVCRLQIRHMIYCLREFKILQPYAIQEPMLYQYLNEILIVVAALTNLQR